MMLPLHTAHAQTPPDRNNLNTTICAKLNQLDPKIEKSLSQKQLNLENHRKEQSNKIQSSFDNKTSQINQSRELWDKNRLEHYDKLSDKANTQEQVDALNQFKSTIESAVIKRRAIYDQANNEYRNAIKNIIGNNQSTIDIVISNYQTQLTQARLQATQDCESNIEDAEVKNNFNSKLKTAKANLEDNKVGIEQISSQISLIRQNRTTLLENAAQEFKTTLQGAKEQLRLALNQ